MNAVPPTVYADLDRVDALLKAIRRELQMVVRLPAPTAPPSTAPAPPTAGGLQDVDAFFTRLTKADSVFGARMTGEQREGCLRLCRAGAGVLPVGWQAYLLATAYHEGGHRMVPIHEWGSGDKDGDGRDDYLAKYDTGRLAAQLGNTPEADGDGIRWAGRGDVMVTGHANYERADAKLAALGLIQRGDLLKNPDLALRPDLSAVIAVYGMKEGWFTGKTFNHYIKSQGDRTQFTKARRIINGTDKAAMIAEYAMDFQVGLIAGKWL